MIVCVTVDVAVAVLVVGGLVIIMRFVTAAGVVETVSVTARPGKLAVNVIVAAVTVEY